jgi:hypothetical protein
LYASAHHGEVVRLQHGTSPEPRSDGIIQQSGHRRTGTRMAQQAPTERPDECDAQDDDDCSVNVQFGNHWYYSDMVMYNKMLSMLLY